MESEIRRKKMIHLFSYFDEDKNNFIERADFEKVAEFTAKARGWQPGEAKYEDTLSRLLEVFDKLQKQADTNDDGKVSVEEWIAMWEHFSKNPSSPLEWQKLHCKFIFDMLDASLDGAIDAEEYSSVFENFGTEKAVAVQSFQKMAKGKSSVSWEDWLELFNEYFVSDEPDAPGNYIFGFNPVLK